MQELIDDGTSQTVTAPGRVEMHPVDQKRPFDHAERLVLVDDPLRCFAEDERVPADLVAMVDEID